MKKIVEKEKLNLGCGADIRKGYMNIDFEKIAGTDMTYDLNKIPYPFKENSFSEILMNSILEHLDNPYGVMKELYRIAKPRATILIRTPHFSSTNAWEDIQHKRGFGLGCFTNSNISKLFEIKKYKIEFSPYRFFMRPLAKFFPFFYENNLAYAFPACDLIVELRVKK